MRTRKSKGIFFIDGQPIFSVEDDKVKDKVCSIGTDGRRSRLRDKTVTITSSELTIIDSGVEFLANTLDITQEELTVSIQEAIKQTDPEALSYGRTKTHTKKTIGALLNMAIDKDLFEGYSWK